MKNKHSEIEKQQEAPGPSPDAEPLVPVEPVAPTAEQLEELKQRAARADENWERLVRTTADFDNYKKRAAREKQEATKFANESLLEKLVPVLDTFDMALAAAENSNTETVQSLQTGIRMVYQQLKSALMAAGLDEVNATGQAFDPNVHEAVSQQETADVPEGHVVQQLRKGYKLHNRLLRPASVVVAKAPAADTRP